MRKFVIFAIMAITAATLVWGAVTAPTSFVASAPTRTKITLTWSGQSTLDSLAIIHLSGSDTLFIAYMDTTATDTTITALTPNTEYILAMYADASGKRAVSTKDTMNTKVEYKYYMSSSERAGSAWMPLNTYDPGDVVDIIYTLNASAETQTSCYFKPEPFTTIGIYLLNSVADSTAFTGMVYGGWDDSTNTAVGGAIQGLDVVVDSKADSIAVTSDLQASNVATKLALLNYDWFYIIWTGDTDCGNNISFMTKYSYSKD